MMTVRSGVLVPMMASLLAHAPAVVRAKETQVVTVRYAVGPEKPLPPGLNAVAVIDAGVETRGTQEQQRERKWSQIAADMIEAMVQTGAAEFSAPLRVVDRRNTRHILQEQDLRLAGLVEGPAAMQAGKLLAVQGLITSDITIRIDEVRDTRSTLDWAAILGNVAGGLGGQLQPGALVQPRPGVVVQPQPLPARPRYVVRRDPQTSKRSRYYYRSERAPRGVPVDPRYAPPPVVLPQPVPVPVPVQPIGQPLLTREVEEISRHITIQCTFALIDAVTGESILRYAPPPIQKQDGSSPDFFFGGMVREVQLDPVDHFIGELVEQETRRFVSMMVPVEVEYTYELIGRHTAGEKAVRALRADDYIEAVALFEANLRKEPDEHESAFALGVVHELMREPGRALDWYRRAAAMDDVDDDELQVYLAAKDRLAGHLLRILKPGAPAPLAAPAATAGAASKPAENGTPGGRDPVRFGFRD